VSVVGGAYPGESGIIPVLIAVDLLPVPSGIGGERVGYVHRLKGPQLHVGPDENTTPGEQAVPEEITAR
jgi:hypothetical protein